MSNFNFEDQIKQSIEQFDELPSDGVWDSLNQKLNQNPVMKNTNNQWIKILSLAAAGALLMMAGYFFLKQETRNNSVEKTEKSDGEVTSNVPLLQQFFKEELEAAKFADKGLAVYVCMENCRFCEKLQKETLAHPNIQALMSENFNQVLVDIKNKDYHPFYKKFKVQGAPAMLFFNNDGVFIEKIVGFRPADTFEEILNTVLEMSENIEPIQAINIPQESIPTELKVYPNPTSGPFTVQIKSDPLTTNVRLIDMNGKELLSEEVKIMDGLYEQEFDLSNHPKGTYIFHCYQKGNLMTEQIIIQ